MVAQERVCLFVKNEKLLLLCDSKELKFGCSLAEYFYASLV